MKNICLTVAYDGTSFLGWQKTRMGPSIEEALERAIAQILQEEISLQAASRTDSGVHARGQIINFLTAKQLSNPHAFLVGVNSLLPDGISVMAVDEVPLSFHPTLNALGKEYRYYICNDTAQFPEFRNTSWHCPHRLNLEAINQASAHFVGTFDFAAFCNVKKNEAYSDTVRTVHAVTISEIQNSRLCITIRGNKFLYKMVRNIVGTLVYVGRGKLNVSDVKMLLSRGSREEAGMTAPAHGLFLHQVNY